MFGVAVFPMVAKMNVTFNLPRRFWRSEPAEEMTSHIDIFMPTPSFNEWLKNRAEEAPAAETRATIIASAGAAGGISLSQLRRLCGLPPEPPGRRTEGFGGGGASRGREGQRGDGLPGGVMFAPVNTGIEQSSAPTYIVTVRSGKGAFLATAESRPGRI